MSMRSDLQKLQLAQSRTTDYRRNLERCYEPTDIKDNLKRCLDRAVAKEKQLSLDFMRTHSAEIGRMLDRETRIRRVIKEFMPQ